VFGGIGIPTFFFLVASHFCGSPAWKKSNKMAPSKGATKATDQNGIQSIFGLAKVWKVSEFENDAPQP